MPDNAAETRADLLRRLHCAEGHLRGIASMVEGENDCESIARQTQAVRAALGEINRRLLRFHLTQCLRGELTAGDQAARAKCITEIVSLYELIGASNADFRPIPKSPATRNTDAPAIRKEPA
jgi:DNA-binding FrmR family transcriptional regulator